MSLHLETLGGLRLVGVEFQRPKPLLLLAYLSLEGPKPRRDLTTLFFSDSDQQADALSTTLRRLRAVNVIDESGGRVAATVTCDANLLREHFEQGHLERVLELYSGVFAAGLSGHLGTDLEEWVFQTRERLAGLVRVAHLELGERALEQGDTRHALKHAEAATHVPGAKEPDQTETKRFKRLLERLGSGSVNFSGAPRTSRCSRF
jgi:DNA-binding SARP family transcriptional activator